MKYLDKNGKEKKSSIVQREITKIVEMHGKITPQLLINEAADAKHPLHHCFEWNDTEAARRYRIGQATQMILAQRFIIELKERKAGVESETHVVRKLLPEYDGESSFKGRIEVLNDEETRKILVERKINALRSWCESVIDIMELGVIRGKILALIR